mmetsp:Transcript_35455/g.56965  ORF Transcript_35455/g.56965 Transcript_35455/m.56965 type:complete len:652 (-) Transcript_35455:178-2133(-)
MRQAEPTVSPSGSYAISPDEVRGEANRWKRFDSFETRGSRRKTARRSYWDRPRREMQNSSSIPLVQHKIAQRREDSMPPIDCVQQCTDPKDEPMMLQRPQYEQYSTKELKTVGARVPFSRYEYSHQSDENGRWEGQDDPHQHPYYPQPQSYPSTRAQAYSSYSPEIVSQHRQSRPESSYPPPRASQSQIEHSPVESNLPYNPRDKRETHMGGYSGRYAAPPPTVKLQLQQQQHRKRYRPSSATQHKYETTSSADGPVVERQIESAPKLVPPVTTASKRENYPSTIPTPKASPSKRVSTSSSNIETKSKTNYSKVATEAERRDFDPAADADLELPRMSKADAAALMLDGSREREQIFQHCKWVCECGTPVRFVYDGVKAGKMNLAEIRKHILNSCPDFACLHKKALERMRMRKRAAWGNKSGGSDIRTSCLLNKTDCAQETEIYEALKKITQKVELKYHYWKRHHYGDFLWLVKENGNSKPYKSYMKTLLMDPTRVTTSTEKMPKITKIETVQPRHDLIPDKGLEGWCAEVYIEFNLPGFNSDMAAHLQSFVGADSLIIKHIAVEIVNDTEQPKANKNTNILQKKKPESTGSGEEKELMRLWVDFGFKYQLEVEKMYEWQKWLSTRLREAAADEDSLLSCARTFRIGLIRPA